MSKPLYMALEMMDPLVEAAEATARAAVRAFKTREPVRRGATIRPGVDSPLWNELVAAVVPHLKKHGEKANLGRLLGVPRQRIHDYFVGRTACPDAERVLLILHWLKSQQAPAPTGPAPADTGSGE